MYHDVGQKIKSVAKIFAILGFIGSFLSLVVCIIIGDSVGDVGIFILIGLLLSGIGCFFAWLGQMLLYAYGQLVDNSDIIVKFLSGSKQGGQPPRAGGSVTYGTNGGTQTVDSAVLQKRFDSWKNNRLITEEEYSAILTSVRNYIGASTLDSAEAELSALKSRVVRGQLTKEQYQISKKSVLNRLK